MHQVKESCNNLRGLFTERKSLERKGKDKNPKQDGEEIEIIVFPIKYSLSLLQKF